jgi:15,16-dihydrobiliverdin:ferredoxin oxidoreductase
MIVKGTSCLWDLFGRRYYEDTRWFSDYMLFGRLERESDVRETLMPAFQEYLTAYTGLATRARLRGGVAERGPEYVRRRHRDYDLYNMERDPAAKLFETYFGSEWAEEYMTRFLFDVAEAKPHVVG